MRSTTEVIYDLSNHKYHNGYLDFISSTSLKKYTNGAIAYKAESEKPRVDKAHFDLGSLVHDVISSKHPNGASWEQEYHLWTDAPVNPKTGQLYGSDTKAFVEPYQLIKAQTGKTPITEQQLEISTAIVNTLFDENSRHPSAKFFKMLFEAGVPEVSYFTTNFADGVNIKTRKDLDGEKFIVDYKTIDGSLEDFIRNIDKLGYDISAGMYVANKEASYLTHDMEVPNIKFYWVVIQVCYPYDWIIVSAQNFLESGKAKFYKLLQIHQQAKGLNHYGSIAELSPNKYGIFVPTPSQWQTKLNNLL